MEKKFKFVFILAVFSSLILIVSCGDKKSEWRGTMEEVDGVMIVKNPKEPMYGEDVFSIEEELSIGEPEGAEEYMFSQMRAVVVDDEERIYVLDRKEAHVKVYDQGGKYLRTIGRKGQGPGELQSPILMHITGQNELAVEDFNYRLAFFSLEGEFERNLLTAIIGALRIHMDSEGNLLAVVIVQEQENPRYELRKFDPEMNFLHSLDSSPLPGATSNGFDPFSVNILSDINHNDQIVTGYPEKYELNVYDKNGTMIRKIMKEHDPLEVTEAEIKEATKGLPPDMKLSIPKFYPAYRWFITDDEGRIFVRTFERVNDGEEYYYDIFDKEGKYIAKIPLGFFPRIWKNSKLYTIEADEDGYQYVKRYKVTWKI